MISNAARAGNVVVVGAGMSGLASAQQLAAFGFEVLVLEGRGRPGGRIWTDHSLDVPIDLGAAWIHGKKKNPIFDISRKVGIKTAPSSFANSMLVDDRGRRVHAIRQVLFAGRANRVIPRLKRIAKTFDKDVSVADAVRRLTAETGMKGEELRFLNRHLIEFQAFNGASLEEQSLHALLDGDSVYAGGDVLFPDGFAQIFEHMAQGIHIKYRETVLAIKHDSAGVSVETNKGVYEADACIVTLPLGVLKSGAVSFSPALPEFMRSSIDSLKMGAFNKIAMRFKEAFWPDDCDMIEQVPEKPDFVCQFLNWYKYSKEPILVACVAADTAREWERESGEELEFRISTLLRKIFGTSASHPIASAITRWGSDEFSLGAYSVVHPGATDRLFDALSEPVGRLFFAGEATARANQGTVTGAYLSGIRAAAQLCDPGLQSQIKHKAVTT